MDRTHLLIDFLEGLVDEVCLTDIALESLDLCAVVFGQLGGDIVGVLGRPLRARRQPYQGQEIGTASAHVDNGNIASSLGDSIGDCESDTTVTAYERLVSSGGWTEARLILTSDDNALVLETGVVSKSVYDVLSYVKHLCPHAEVDCGDRRRS